MQHSPSRPGTSSSTIPASSPWTTSAFGVAEGICFGLLGPNGAGKTTTVEIIEGVTTATAGEVWYFGEPAGQRFREEAGIQFQNTALQDHLTVKRDPRHVSQPVRPSGRPRRTSSNNARSATSWTATTASCPAGSDSACSSPWHSSTGRDSCFSTSRRPASTRRRGETSGILFRESRRTRGTTVILTTHYMDEAHVLCDEIAIMDAMARSLPRARPTSCSGSVTTG